MLKITLAKGLIGKTDRQRRVVAALGLGKFGSSVVHADSVTIRGMVNKISHLVTVVPTDEAVTSKSGRSISKDKEKSSQKSE